MNKNKIELNGSGGFLMISREVVRLASTDAAIVYGELISLLEQRLEAGETVLIEDKIFFPARRKDISDETALPLHRISPAVQQLVSIGALETVRIGGRGINHYHIDQDRMFELFEVKTEGGDL